MVWKGLALHKHAESPLIHSSSLFSGLIESTALSDGAKIWKNSWPKSVRRSFFVWRSVVRCKFLYGKHRILFFFQGFFLCLQSFRFVVASRLTAPQYTSFLYVSLRVSARLVFALFGNSFRFLKPKWSLFFLHLHLCMCLWLLWSALCVVFVFALFSAAIVTVFSYSSCNRVSCDVLNCLGERGQLPTWQSLWTVAYIKALLLDLPTSPSLFLVAVLEVD